MRFVEAEKRKRTVNVELTSMIDVVFLLIIFFMTTSQFAKVTRAEVSLPQEAGEQNPTPEEAGLVINITENGTIIVNGATLSLADLENIIMNEWGPYDWQSPLLTLVEKTANRHVYRMLGNEKVQSVSLDTSNADLIKHELNDSLISLTTTAMNQLIEYAITATTDSGPHKVNNSFMPMQWEILCFKYDIDPRKDVQTWRKEAAINQNAKATLSSLDLNFGMGGPSKAGIAVHGFAAQLPDNHFGTFADSSITLPAGKWRLKTTSDDGIRVWLDDNVVIDDWTWHGPKPHKYEFTLTHSKTITLHIEHFELDGYAILNLDIERVND